jgi:acyl-CoA synthetase (NDP forming)
MNIMKQMKLFMEPRSIAVVGITRSAGVGAFNPVETLLNCGFAGKIYPVNPNAEQILGLKAYPNVKVIPEDIDLALISTPRDTVPPLVRECVEKGIKAIIVIAQGFADADEEGKALQAQIVKIAKEGGARIIGPNTFGLTNVFCDFSTTPGLSQTERNPIGVISQTGLFFLGFPRLKFGKVIDLGNACDIDPADALAYFEDDPDIKVIVLHIEGIQEGKNFLRVAKRVARKKPVIAFKGGKSETGAQAVQCHTGSLVGKDEIYEAAFGQCGIIRASDAEELEDLSLALLRLPPMKGRRLAVMSWAGAIMVFAADACERYGLELAQLSPATVSKIRQLAPLWLPIHNPIDLWASIGLVFDPRTFKERIRIVLEALLDEENADAVLTIIPDFVELFGQSGDISSLLLDAADTSKHRPLIFSIIGPPGKFTAELEQSNRTVVFASPDRGVRALSKLWSYTQRFKGT